jgi:hypothetical protein
MRVLIKDTKSGDWSEGLIEVALKKDMPFKKDGWQFNWKKLFQIEGSSFFKLTTLDTPEVIEGMIMLTILNEEMVFMNNIEVAPGNYGEDGKYENVAGCLLGFACYKSFEWGKDPYLGFLSFDSKTQLIEFYQKKYGASWAMGQKMFFTPDAGKKLMKEYLKFEF